MKHYVRVSDAQTKAAKDLVEKLGHPRPINYNGGPGFWLLHVEERAAIALLSHFAGSTCTTVRIEPPVEATPDAEIILTRRTGTR